MIHCPYSREIKCGLSLYTSQLEVLARKLTKSHRIASRRGSVPPLVDVTHQLRPPDRDVPDVAVVRDQRLEASRVRGLVHVDDAAVQNVGGNAAL